MKTMRAAIALGLLLAPASVWAETVVKSEAADQTAVALTIYNDNLGLVQDTRRLTLPTGTGFLHFMDVTANIMPETVKVAAPNSGGFRVFEQNYEYDLMSQEKVLDKYVGKKIKILKWNDYQDRADAVEATLLSNEGQIYQVNDEIYLGYPGTRIVPKIPDNLIAKPTLSWLYENPSAEPLLLNVSYLTSGMNWHTDYVLLVGADDTFADLSGWVTIQNQSGASFQDASLKLMAGNVNRVRYNAPAGIGGPAMAMRAMADKEFVEESFFEYHLYNLQRKTTIKNNQTKQISLLETHGVAYKKEYFVWGNSGYFYQKFADDLNQKMPVEVNISFINAKDNQLGMPLPMGTVRIYKEGADKTRQFIGEDSIGHTPVDEKVKLKVGEAFDIVAERKQLDFQQITSRKTESEWEITIRNRKDEDIQISLFEPISGEWKILTSTHPTIKENASTVRLDIPVAKKAEVKVQYRVSMEY